MKTTDVAHEKAKIKELYDKVPNKTDLQIRLGNTFGVEPLTVRNNWFGKLLSVPKRHRTEVLEILKKESTT